MKQEQKKDVRELAGTVTRIYDERNFIGDDGGPKVVRNFEMAVEGEDGVDYVQGTGHGPHAVAAIRGYRFDVKKAEWVQVRSELAPGDNVTLKGNFRMKPWNSELHGKVEKPTITFYRWSALSVVTVPPLPWQVSEKPRRNRKTK